MKVKNRLWAEKVVTFLMAVVLLTAWLALDGNDGRLWPIIPLCLLAVAVSWWLSDRVIWKKRGG